MSANDGVYNFLLFLSGVSEPDAEFEDALFEAGCDDATLAFRNGVCCLEFDRKAPSLDEAIVSASRGVERADSRLRIASVKRGDFVTRPKSPGESS